MAGVAPGNVAEMRAWISLGGNLEDSPAALCEALRCLSLHMNIDVDHVSSWYQTAAWGVSDQPDFLNAVAVLSTTLEPVGLLHELLAVEKRLGRVRNGRQWGPRLVDLDLLTYEDACIDTDELQLPHPRMHQRAFVLIPLIELQANFEIPGRGAAKECLSALPEDERRSVALIEQNEGAIQP